MNPNSVSNEVECPSKRFRVIRFDHFGPECHHVRKSRLIYIQDAFRLIHCLDMMMPHRVASNVGVGPCAIPKELGEVTPPIRSSLRNSAQPSPIGTRSLPMQVLFAGQAGSNLIQHDKDRGCPFMRGRCSTRTQSPDPRNRKELCVPPRIGPP